MHAYTPLGSLPTDRAYLHFECVHLHGDQFQVDYELVLPLRKVDCRGTWDHKGRKTRPKTRRHVWLDTANNRRLPLGRTTVGSANPSYPILDSTLTLPFRDGVHSSWDNEKLGGLPVIYTREGKHWTVTVPPREKKE